MSTKEITVRGWTQLEPGDVIVHADKTGAPPEFVVRREVPEWKSGTTGTATLNHLVSGNSSDAMRVMRVEWDGLHGFATQTGRIVEDGSTTYSVSDFVPDAPGRTRLQVTKAVTREEFADALAQHYGDYDGLDGTGPNVREQYLTDADALLALLGGESR